MAQHDMNIANQGFPATRADLNNALQALVSNSSGTSEPSTTFANQWWYDTTNNKMYLRNEANNAWIEVFTLDQTSNEWQITTGQISAGDSDGLVFKTDDGNTRITLSDGGDVTFADGTDVITASAGTDNTRIGSNAGDSIVSGANYNVLVGKNAGTTISTGDNNLAVGTFALENTTTGSSNVALGYGSLENSVTASGNTAVGTRAIQGCTSSNNTVIGYQAAYNATSIESSVIVGYEAGLGLTTGNWNVLIGREAGKAISSGGDNTMIGPEAGELMTTGNNNVIIGNYDGNQDGLDIRTSSNQIVLSDGDGNVRLHVHDDGEVNIKRQPALSVGVGTNNWVTSTAGDLVPFDTEHVDVGNNFNTTTYKYTIPVAGIYFWSIMVNRLTDSRFDLSLYKNGSRIRTLEMRQTDGSSTEWQIESASGVYSFAANDVLDWRVSSINSAGTGMADGNGHTFDNWNMALLS